MARKKILPSVVTHIPFLLLFCLREVSNCVINAKGSETISAPYRTKPIPPSFPLWPGEPTSLLHSVISQATLLNVAFNQDWKQVRVFTLQSLPFPGSQPWGSASLLSSMILAGQVTEKSQSAGFQDWRTLLHLGHIPWSCIRKQKKLPGYKFLFVCFFKQTLTQKLHHCCI